MRAIQRVSLIRESGLIEPRWPIARNSRRRTQTLCDQPLMIGRMLEERDRNELKREFRREGRQNMCRAAGSFFRAVWSFVCPPVD